MGVKRKATAYCDALGCPINQTVLMNDREDSESQLRRLGWRVGRETGNALCPQHATLNIVED
ncbi:hypothetical protein SEA_CAIB_68 [Gordonia phage CaiB]|nr:hypothetical protein SEA_CAIB_68 [Gordonia phage CaiB]